MTLWRNQFSIASISHAGLDRTLPACSGSAGDGSVGVRDPLHPSQAAIVTCRNQPVKARLAAGGLEALMARGAARVRRKALTVTARSTTRTISSRNQRLFLGCKNGETPNFLPNFGAFFQAFFTGRFAPHLDRLAPHSRPLERAICTYCSAEPEPAVPCSASLCVR